MDNGRINLGIHASGSLVASLTILATATVAGAVAPVNGVAATLILAAAIVPLIWVQTRARSNLPILPTTFAILGTIALVSITWNAVRSPVGGTWADLFLATSLVGLVPIALADRTIRSSISPLAVSGAALLAAGVVASALFNGDFSGIAPGLLVAAVLIMPPIVVAGAAKSLSVQLLALAIVAGAATNAIGGIIERLALFPLRQTFGLLEVYGYGERVSGLAGNPIQLGLACAIAMPIALLYSLRGEGRLSRALFAACGALCMSGVFLSGSRAALIAGMIGALLVLPAIGKSRWFAAATLIAVSLAVGTALSIRGDDATLLTLDRLTGSISTGNADAGRLAQIGEGLAAFEESPILGKGYTDVRDSHDIYVELAASGGAVALVAFALYLTGVGRTAWRLRNLLPARACIAGVCVYLIFGVVLNPIYDRYLWLPVGLLFAATVGTNRLRPPMMASTPADVTIRVPDSIAGTRASAATPIASGGNIHNATGNPIGGPSQ